ncbi:MAG: amidohydrolase family protein [Myxococcales bacterium]|nr:amidohydrolase family protein [Myxococcales bacterium]
MSQAKVTAADVRASLGHPVIDADGHLVEYWPELDRYLRAEGVEAGMGAFLATANFDGSPVWETLDPDARLRERAYRSPWWGFPNDARDLATASAPELLYRRLDEFGIDLAVCYPSVGLQLPAQRDDRLRRLGCRAYNRYAADQFEGLSDRLLPVAVIPTVTPSEAVEELEFAVLELGFRAAMIAGFAVRAFDDGGDRAVWIDSLGLDSLYDYDPLWRRLVELRIAPAFHSGSMGWSGRRSISNFSYNHMGNFAGAGEATAKSMFFGGVFHRFPELRVAYLEGGVSWAVQLLVSLVEHWEKRGPAGLRELDPSGLDAALFDRLVAEHAGRLTAQEGWGETLKKTLDTRAVVNDFEAAGIKRTEDIVRQIGEQCFFGCEADDPLVGLAFDTARVPGGRPLAPVFSSDIGHWDVAHMHEVLPEAHEHLEKGWLDRDQFRGFMCDNVLRMYTGANPEFFAGTVLEDYALERGAGNREAR